MIVKRCSARPPLEHFATTFRDNAGNPKAKAISRMTWISVNHVLATVRERAAKLGFDWSRAVFPAARMIRWPAKMIAAAKQEREAALQMYAREEAAKRAAAGEVRQ